MPGSAKDKSDSVGVAEVIECGEIRHLRAFEGAEWQGVQLEPGDIIAYMPFTDVLIDAGNFKNHALVAYESIRAVKKGVPTDAAA